MRSAKRVKGSQEGALRKHLLSELNAHMASLGYKTPRAVSGTIATPEIVRRNAVRGRLAYGETILSSDLDRSGCHVRLMDFSRRRTRRRSSILFFIGVKDTQRDELESLLGELGIVSAAKGGHVHVVPIPTPE